MVIVSTCNRTELYAISSRSAFGDLETFLAEVRGLERAEIAAHLYRYQAMEAIQHLFEVSAGLDSLVIGEPQILGQITHALELARGQGASGPVLNRLFQAAIYAGKRARTDTNISRSPASVASLAASHAERTIQSLETAQIVILGAGEMAELAVDALRKRGAQNLLVVNRTLQRAHALAERWGAAVSTFENLAQALTSADILISSTGAPHIIVSAALAAEAMQFRPQRPLVLIDIALPRDIDPACAALDNVCLFDLDGLNAQLEQSLSARLAEVPQVKAILAQELALFGEYLSSLEMLPLIADMHQNAEAIRQAELEKTLRRLPGLSEAERARIDALTQALVKKLLESPTRRLHAEASQPHAVEYAALARSLFGLEYQPPKPPTSNIFSQPSAD